MGHRGSGSTRYSGVCGWGSRKYGALEGYGNQYQPIRSSILAGEPPSLTEKPGRPVYRVTAKATLQAQTRDFSARGSSAQ